MNASLVWDGTDQLWIPEPMGAPRADQMQGTVGERLGEVNGRICYDSLGKGRSSTSFHEHISQVKHFSVYEHYMVTLELPVANDLVSESYLLWCLINRPGVWVEDALTRIRITLNPRVILDWDSLKTVPKELELANLILKLSLHVEFLAKLCPEIEKHTRSTSAFHRYLPFSIVQPETEDEKWISLYMQGSRGFSHEQVRHGDFSAISQRSTRYVDECDSDWVAHPLITAWLEEHRKVADAHADDISYRVNEKIDESFIYLNPAQPVAQEQYKYCVATLEPWLIEKGVDKVTARKQARGAARGYLGNALSTELIFSASVTQWKRQLKQRLNAAADAEIRQVYVKVLEALKQSRYANCLENFTTKPSPDGIGLVLE